MLERLPRRAQIDRLTTSYEEGLLEDLQDPDEAAAYLSAALEDGSPEVFLLALRHVATARGMPRVAAEANLSRESMYRMLSRRGNPRLSSLRALLDSVGLRLAVEVAPTTDTAAV